MDEFIDTNHNLRIDMSATRTYFTIRLKHVSIYRLNYGFCYDHIAQVIKPKPNHYGVVNLQFYIKI